jgi:hypothetical protein
MNKINMLSPLKSVIFYFLSSFSYPINNGSNCHVQQFTSLIPTTWEIEIEKITI